MNLILDGESNVSLIQSYHSELKKYQNLFYAYLTIKLHIVRNK